MTPRDVALSYLKSFSTGDPDAVADHVTENFRNNQVGLIGDGCQGRDVYRERLKGFLATFQDLRYTAEKVIDKDDDVAVAYRMTATEQGRALDIRGVMIITVADGKVAVRSDYWDGLTYQNQMESDA